MYGMDRVATGIQGFDSLVEGGLPKGSNILLTGAPGTGKTIFGLHYLYNGAMNGEKGVYISLDSSVELLRVQAKQFGMDFTQLEKDGKVLFLRVPLTKMKFNLFDAIEKVKEQIDAQRVVFDSMATFAVNLDLFTIPLGYVGNTAASVTMSASSIEKLNANDKGGMNAPSGSDKDTILYTGNSEKRMIYLIIEELASLRTTNLIITYGNMSGNSITSDGVSEFACDGIIEMHNELIGAKRIRTMSILKMRDTGNSQFVHDIEIGKEGLSIKPAEQV